MMHGSMNSKLSRRKILRTIQKNREDFVSEYHAQNVGIHVILTFYFFLQKKPDSSALGSKHVAN